jgi:hypothetical protein
LCWGGDSIPIARSVWYSTGLPAVPLRWVLVGDPRGVFRTQGVLCTNLCGEPEPIIFSWYIRRWRMEVAFQEAHRHLGFETGRQWSEMVIRRTVPALLRLFSLVILFADTQEARLLAGFKSAAWYDKQLPTSADTLAPVRKSRGLRRLFAGPLGGQHAKRPSSPRGTLDRCASLHGVTAKVAQKINAQ